MYPTFEYSRVALRFRLPLRCFLFGIHSLCGNLK
jgi:hypothetical protein